VDTPTAEPAPSTAVDVVISCHDQGDLILGAVASALAQTYLPQTVVIVDDGSTDPVTLRALDTLEAANDARIVLIRQSNQHVSANR
jgi:glycosyltransferase involved in cell wall biosynthesis